MAGRDTRITGSSQITELDGHSKFLPPVSWKVRNAIRFCPLTCAVALSVYTHTHMLVLAHPHTKMRLEELSILPNFTNLDFDLVLCSHVSSVV